MFPNATTYPCLLNEKRHNHVDDDDDDDDDDDEQDWPRARPVILINEALAQLALKHFRLGLPVLETESSSRACH